MGNFGLQELLVISVIALLVIGPRRLPELARACGEAFRSFQQTLRPLRFPSSDWSVDAGAPPPDRAEEQTEARQEAPQAGEEVTDGERP